MTRNKENIDNKMYFFTPITISYAKLVIETTCMQKNYWSQKLNYLGYVKVIEKQ